MRKEAIYAILVLLAIGFMVRCHEDNREKDIASIEKARDEADKACAIAYDNAEMILNWCEEIEDEQVRDSIQKYAEKISYATFDCDACSTLDSIAEELGSNP